MPSAAAAARWLIAWLSAPAIALELPKSLPLRVDHPDLSTIEMQSLHEHMAEYTIVDVRSPYEYNVLHIRDAINLSVADLHFRERLKELYAAKQKPVVTYCNGETCPLSFLAAEVAHSERIPVFVYDAGIWYWARNFPDQAALMPGAKRLIPPEEFKSHLHASRITARCGTDTALHRASLPRQERFSFPREPHLPSPRRGDVTLKAGRACFVAWVGVFLLLPTSAVGDDSEKTLSALQEFSRLRSTIRDNYLEPVADERLFELAIAGVYEAAGTRPPAPGDRDGLSYDNAGFVEAVRRVQQDHPELDDVRLVRAGAARMARLDEMSLLVSRPPMPGPAWVGLELKKEGPDIVVMGMIINSAAAKSSILPGDRLKAIDGESLGGATVREAVDKLFGPYNSTAQLRIVRGGAIGLTIPVRRDTFRPVDIECPAVQEGVAYARLHHVRKETAEALGNWLAFREKQGPVRGLVLDLRDSYDGGIGYAVAVANLFLAHGRIVESEGRPRDLNVTFTASTANARYRDLPLVLLMNENTATAGEVLAAALQDNHRATVVGAVTAGRGTVTGTYTVGESVLQLTVVRLFRPSGRPLAEHVVPDVVMRDDTPTSGIAWHPCGTALASRVGDNAVQRAFELLGDGAAP